jgi:hypothetical protein
MSLEGTGDTGAAESPRCLAREPNTQDEQTREDHYGHPKESTCPAAAKDRVEHGHRQPDIREEQDDETAK